MTSLLRLPAFLRARTLLSSPKPALAYLRPIAYLTDHSATEARDGAIRLSLFSAQINLINPRPGSSRRRQRSYAAHNAAGAGPGPTPGASEGQFHVPDDVVIKDLAGIVSDHVARLGMFRQSLLSAILLHELLLRRGVPSKLVKGYYLYKPVGTQEVPEMGYDHVWVEAAGKQWDVQSQVQKQLGIDKAGFAASLGLKMEELLVNSLPPDAWDLDAEDEEGRYNRTALEQMWKAMEGGSKGLDSVDTYWRLVPSTPATRALRQHLMHMWQ